MPDYRGAAPIHWAVINGDTQTGATTFHLAHEIDTGGILDQLTLEIGPNDTTGDVHDRMMVEGAQLLVKTVDKIANGEANPILNLSGSMREVIFAMPPKSGRTTLASIGINPR